VVYEYSKLMRRPIGHYKPIGRLWQTATKLLTLFLCEGVDDDLDQRPNSGLYFGMLVWFGRYFIPGC